MNPLLVTELFIVAAALLVVVTQVIIPMRRGTPMFPLFREERKLERDLEEAQEGANNAGLRKRIDRIRKKADQ